MIDPSALKDVAPLTPAAKAPILPIEIVLPEAVKELNAVDEPIAPVMLTDSGPPINTNAWAPSTVPDNTILPKPVPELSVASPLSWIALKKERLPPFVVILADRELLPAPFWVNPAADMMFAPDPSVNVAPFVTVTPPLPDVVTG